MSEDISKIKEKRSFTLPSRKRRTDVRSKGYQEVVKRPWEAFDQEISFRMHVMPIAVGMYLPFGLTTPILIGGLLAHVVSASQKGAAADRRLHRGVLFASGMIAGESLTGVGIALMASLGIARLALGLPERLITVLTVVGAVAVLASFYRFSRPKPSGES